MASRFFQALAALAVILPLLAVAWCAHADRCFQRCDQAVARSRVLADEGDLRGAIMAIDQADAACRCERFTEGDEPPEHSRIRLYLGELEAEGAHDEVTGILEDARGPLLRGFRDPPGGPRPPPSQ